VILLSARAGDEAVVEGLSGGADDYLVKPFSSRELVARVSTQLELNRLRREAEDANRSKDDFLAMLGHELRNPLAPIMTALQLMRLRAGDSAAREREIIERQVRIMARLVDDLLDVARVIRGKIALQREPIEMSEVVAKALETAGPAIAQHGHHLEIDVPPTGCRVEADAARLTQIVSNLLTNAAKYTPAGGEIDVACHSTGGEVVLSVKDTGIGLAPEMLPKVFELFAQDRDAMDHAPGGLGLGLAIAKNLARLHGGTIEAYSEGRGRGSEFVVRLPALR
jgi:signal transduction histidine kinase